MITMKSELIFRQPMPFKQCHASTILELPGGRFIAACFGGTLEGRPDVAIWGAIRTGNGWGKSFLLAKVNDMPHWNPVLFMGQDKSVNLFFKVGNSCGYWKTWIMKSYDFCETWTVPEPLVPGCCNRGPAKNKCIILSNGNWLAPSSSEIGWWQPFVDWSWDMGKSWQRGGLIRMDKKIAGKLEKDIPGLGPKGMEMRYAVIQPTLWESEAGHIHMMMRSSSKHICRSDSKDYGRTWCKIYETSLPNNNSGIDMVKMADGTLILAYNPVASHWGDRWPMTLALSKNNGISWEKLLDTDTEPKEYSYPAIIAASDGGVALTYTWGRDNIKFIKLEHNEIYKG